ncbi:unnamed protein product [Ceutorhynchus assimilis]|uniref:Tyr recombinase domain-containing protein n=1 Tax=Ceutorhynchus assimilis TaxID=467358 RepID=A0A9N9MD89_9CUCU|nr:unnamed protein product [Ceutorhynchus assimilis]
MFQNPEYIADKAKEIVLDLLPRKSRAIYHKEYDAFIEWKHENGIFVVNEDVLLNYLHEKSQTFKPSTVWSKYSMLKAVLSVKENIHIDQFPRVIAFLKRNSVGYEPKKSKVLSREEIDQFLATASDETYLLTKVALVIGLCGACRREELHSLQVQDITEKDNNCLLVTLADTKTNIKRVFPVVGEGNSANSVELYRKYACLRPKNVPHDYVFISYRKGKCTMQRVGIHSFGKMPSIVATFLNLPNPNEYTGHCFRRSAATLVADAGVDFTALKRLGGWRSSTVAEGYIEESIEKKKKVCKLLMGEKKNRDHFHGCFTMYIHIVRICSTSENRFT